MITSRQSLISQKIFPSSSLLTFNQIHFDFAQNNYIQLVKSIQEYLQKEQIMPYIIQILDIREQQMKTLMLKNKQAIKNFLDQKVQIILKQLQKNIHTHNKKYNQKCKKKQNKQKDIFYWLNIHSKYNALEVLLKKILVEKINIYQNQIKILETLEKKKKNTKKGSFNSNSQIKINIKYKSKTKPNIYQEKYNFLNYQTWNLQDQKKAKNKINQLKNVNKQIHQCNPHWSILSLQQKINQINLIERTKYQRQKIIQKYRNAQLLTQQQKNYIIKTSQLLNSCLDKEYINEAISVFNKKIIDDLQLQISNNIINNYKYLQQKLIKMRHNFLKQHNEKVKRNIKANSQYLAKPSQQQKSKLKKYTQKIFKPKQINPYFIHTQPYNIIYQKKKKQKIHQKHPGSALLLMQETQQWDHFAIQRNNKRNQYMERMKVKSMFLYNKKNQYFKMYSGGPIENKINLHIQEGNLTKQ